MKIINILFYFLILTLGITSCGSDDETIEGEYMFISEYSTTVTVGGIVGVTERTFETGEIYKGTYYGEETITIRIAEHTELNNDCPNSWCHQEFLEVPREFLRLVK